MLNKKSHLISSYVICHVLKLDRISQSDQKNRESASYLVQVKSQNHFYSLTGLNRIKSVKNWVGWD